MLLPVPELEPEPVGGRDCEHAHQRERALPRPAGGASASSGSASLPSGEADSEATAGVFSSRH